LFSEELGVFPLGFFYFGFQANRPFQQLSTDFYSPQMVFMSIIKLNNIHFLESFLLHFRFFIRYKVMDGKP